MNLLRPLWKLQTKISARYVVPNDKVCVVVLGLQRGGTSVVCDLVHALDVDFGDAQQLMKPDIRNPQGFFENVRLKKTLISMLTQANYQYAVSEGKPLRALGLPNKIRRVRSRIVLQKILKKIATNKNEPNWGIKSFPIFYYFLKSYIPNRKVIAVYRHPLAVGESFITAWPRGFFTFSSVIDIWTKGMQDVLYHLSSEKDTLLIRYEDLLNEQSRDLVLDAIHEFVGQGDRKALNGIVTNSLNRSMQTFEKLSAAYPLPADTQRILDSLDALRAR